ncbi:hypothetical protein [Streptomyces sp. NPDC005301]|uniref:hypothetical protein n=1 Tax=Streptomyces sp. NPDC005301 TaxID=3156874 RepID=UPI0033A946F1
MPGRVHERRLKGREAAGEPKQQGRTRPARKTASKFAAETTKKQAPAKKASSAKRRPTATTGSRAGTDKNELRQLSKAELYQRATEQNVTGRSKMSRSQLIDSLAGAGRRRKKTAA